VVEESEPNSDRSSEIGRLRSEVALYRDTIEHMHQGLCVFDAGGRIALCNSRYADVLQLPPEKVRPGLSARELIELGMAAGYYSEGLTAEQLEQHMWANLQASPTERSTLVRGGRTYAVLPDRTSAGNWVATFEDVTTRIDAENALRESEARLRAILDAMPDCVKIFDESGQLVHINPKGLELLQAPDIESLSRPGYLAVPPEYLDACIDVHRRVIAGESVAWSYEVVGLEGRRRHVEAHAVPFRLPDGAPAHMCISRDVNERKEGEDALRRSEERLRLVQEATGLADFEAGPDGVAHFSPRLLKLMGLPEDGRAELAFEDWIHLVHPGDRERLRQTERTLSTRDSAYCEFRVIHTDTGETRWIAASLKMERDQAGKVRRAIGAHLDITERKLADEGLRRSE
jgi:PAS domain S-box-containing protein